MRFGRGGIEEAGIDSVPQRADIGPLRALASAQNIRLLLRNQQRGVRRLGQAYFFATQQLGLARVEKRARKSAFLRVGFEFRAIDVAEIDDHAPGKIRWAAKGLGADNDYIYKTLLNLDDQEIETYREQGIL